MFGRYDVRAAKHILKAKPRASEPLDLAAYGALLKMVAGVSHAGIDLGVPVIVVKISADLLPIDGWSRIAKATHQGLSSLPAVRLSAAEARSIRLA
jgi:hypothetical protein